MKQFLAAVLALSATIAAAADLGADYWKKRYDDTQTLLAQSDTPETRFMRLDAAATTDAEVGKLLEAARFATELESLAPSQTANPIYGQVIHDIHMIRGRVALAKGDLDGAVAELKKSVEGPAPIQRINISLARELRRRQKDAEVVEYLERAKTLDKRHTGAIDLWIASIKNGKEPEWEAFRV